MRYYIVNNLGWICGEADTKSEAELILSKYTDQEIEEQELEIIDDELAEERYGNEYFYDDAYRPLYDNDKRSLTIGTLERILVERWGNEIELGCNTWEGGWFSTAEILKQVSDNI